MDRRGGIKPAAVQARDGHLHEFAQCAFGDEPRNRRAKLEIERRGNNLGDEARVYFARGKHLARLREVHRHARLTEHVLPRAQGGSRVLAVLVRPGADANRVDARIGEEVGDIGVHPGDAELVGDALAAEPRTVAHCGDFDAIDLLEAGNMHRTGIGTRANKTNAEWHSEPHLG